jgi:hypothetical protein
LPLFQRRITAKDVRWQEFILVRDLSDLCG